MLGESAASSLPAAQASTAWHLYADRSSNTQTPSPITDAYAFRISAANEVAPRAQTQLRLIKAAFACDLVRTATFMWPAGTNWVVFPGSFKGATIKGNLQSTPHHPPSHSDPSGDPNTPLWSNQINQFYSTATSQVLQEFATTPDVDGNMLIDRSMTWW